MLVDHYNFNLRYKGKMKKNQNIAHKKQHQITTHDTKKWCCNKHKIHLSWYLTQPIPTELT